MKFLNLLKQKRYIILALIIYFITCITLYMVQYRLYGGTIDTNFIIICIFSISYFVGWLCRDHDKPIKKAQTTLWSKIGTICGSIILILCTLFLINKICKNIYEFKAYLNLALMFILAIIYVSNKLERLKQFNATSVSIIFGTLLITTLLYGIILNPFTVKEATVYVQNSGFTNVSYKNNIKNQKSLSYILETEITDSTKYEGNLGYYLFQGEKDEKDYAIVVSVTKGNIVVFEDVKNNSTFQYLLERKITY